MNEKVFGVRVYDADIRALLLHSFINVADYTSEEDTVIINEMDVCAGLARADVAVVNGKIHGYEIKSSQDNLERLPFQANFYNRVFNTMTIVASEHHIEKIEKIVPEWWSICSVAEKNGHLCIEDTRKGDLNKWIDYDRVAMLLWKDEMIDLLALAGITRGLKSKTREQLSILIGDKVDPLVIDDYVRNRLKFRSDWKAVQLRQLSDDWQTR